MKKILLVALAALLFVSASAQDLLRYNYKKNNYIYTGTERVRVVGTTPLEVKLSRVTFPDGENVYILRVEYEEATAWKMPKNAPLTIFTTDGKNVTLKNSSDSPNLVAPSGIKTSAGKVYWNYGEYYMEEADLKKIASGVSSIDATKRWSSEGVIKVSYKNDEFGSAIRRQMQAINSAPVPKSEISNSLKSISDQGGNRLVETEKVHVNSQLAVSLVYLYYAESNNENYDLNLFISGKTVPLGGAVYITTTSGQTIELQQEKDLSAGRVICYPTIEQLKLMSKGVSKITVHTVSSPVTINITDGSFGAAVDKLYCALQPVTIL